MPVAKDQSTLVQQVVSALDALSRSATPHGILRGILRPTLSIGRWNRITDIYALFWAGLSAIMLLLIAFGPSRYSALNSGLGWSLVALSFWRMIEVVAFHLRAALVVATPHRDVGTVASHSRALLLLILNYFEVVLWFACWYSLARHAGLLVAPTPATIAIFRESLSLMVANTTGLIQTDPANGPSRPVLHTAVWLAFCFQMVVGLFLTLVVVSRAVAAVPMPAERRQENSQGSGGP